jgi:hypothetical protein
MAPASLYIILPTLADGTPGAFSCFGFQTETSARAVQADETQFNYGVDFGYMYQF